MDIVLVSSFTQANDRYKFLVDLMDPQEFSVEFVTSKFLHYYKKHRDLTTEQPEGFRCPVTYLDEPGYKKNVSLGRIRSNRVLGRNVYRYLCQRKKPDLILSASPALDLCYKVAHFAKSYGIPFILDLRDIWPEAFKMVFNVPILSDLLFLPFEKRANYIYSHADAIVGVSNTFLNRARCNAQDGIPMERVVLGSDLALFDRFALENKVKRNDDEIWVAYVGTLGHSYDIKNVILALRKLRNDGFDKVRFVVMGTGPLEDSFKEYARQCGILCTFTGRLPYPRMVGMLSVCDIVINPIVKRSAASLINKVADYAASGLPVVNTQESLEYRDLVEQYGCGLNCKCEDVDDIALKLKTLLMNPELCRKMGQANRQLAVDVFDRRTSYQRIIELFRKFK